MSEGLRKLQCRSLIFVGDGSPFHIDALYMTSKLDRRYCALVEVRISVFSICIACNFMVPKVLIGEITIGSGLRIDGDGRAASRHVDTVGVFPNGLWALQAF